MFSSARIFGGLEAERSDYLTSQFVIVPVPYDATTTYRSGTRDGPRAIIDASLQMELWDLELGCEPADHGIHTFPEVEPHLGSSKLMVERVRDVVAGVISDDKVPIMIGGEHTLTAGAVEACGAVYPDLAILYLDAHADVRDPYLGAEWNHASALRLSIGAIRRGRAVSEVPVVAVGIRSAAAEEADYIRENELRVVLAQEVAETRYGGMSARDRMWDEVLERLGPRETPLYISVDLDCLDPSVIAAVGTPEPGGLDWYEVTSLLRRACERFKVVGADVVELAPDEGPVAGTFAAAKLVYKLVGYIGNRAQGGSSD